jgi:hypothetical protein
MEQQGGVEGYNTNIYSNDNDDDDSRGCRDDSAASRHSHDVSATAASRHSDHSRSSYGMDGSRSKIAEDDDDNDHNNAVIRYNVPSVITDMGTTSDSDGSSVMPNRLAHPQTLFY